MQRLRAMLLLSGVLMLTSALTYAQSVTTQPPGQSSTLLTWAPVLSAFLSAATLIAIFLNVGRWMQRSESTGVMFEQRLITCRRECDARLENLHTHGSQFANRRIDDFKNEFVRKDLAKQEYEALSRLMEQGFAQFNLRFEKLERWMEAQS